jgi:hypothetical protein
MLDQHMRSAGFIFDKRRTDDLAPLTLTETASRGCIMRGFDDLQQSLEISSTILTRRPAALELKCELLHFLRDQQAQSNVIFNWSDGTANSPYLVRGLAVYS